MKKKILLTLAIAMVFTCLLAIFVSAENIGGIEYTLNEATKTATFAASNRTDCTLTRVVIPETVVGADGETYTVTAIADRSIGHQDAGAGNKYIEYLYIPKTVTYLGAQLVRNCYALKEVKIDASVTKLSAGDFWSCTSLETLDLSGMSNLVTIDQITSSVSKLKTVKLPSSVQTIGGKAFQSAGSIEAIVLPSGLTTIGSNTFQSTKIQILVLPSTLNSVGASAFDSVSTVKTLVFANTSFEGWNAGTGVFKGVNPTTIFFAGSNPATLTSYNKNWASYSTISYNDYIANPSSLTANTIVYGTENCTCGYIRTAEAPTVNFTSYTEKTTVEKNCAHCEKTTVIKTIDPMFTCLGYSVAEYSNGISVGYAANNKAIDEYENVTGKDVSYGVFAVLQSKLREDEIFDNSGNKGNGVVNADLTSRRFDIFEFKIIGIPDDKKDTKLALGAYISVTGENGTEYSYLQVGTKAENEKYVFVTYNEVTK